MKKLYTVLAVVLSLFVAIEAMALRPCEIRNHVTAVLRDASTPKDCTIGYALDDDTFSLRAGGAWVALTLSGTTLLDDAQIVLGTGSDAVISYDKTVQAPDTLIIAVGVDSRQLVIFEKHATDLAADLTVAQRTDPTINLHSADSTDANDYILFYMDQTNGVIDVGQGSVSIPDPVVITGDLTINGAAGSLTFLDGDETMVIKDNDANSFMVTSSGAAAFVTFDTTTDGETLILSGTTTADVLHVDVGTAQFDESVDITGVLAVTGSATVSTTLSVTQGANLAIPVMALHAIRFCGQGPNGATPNYMGPVLLDDTEADLAFGGAGCDALDSTTETTADAPWHASFAFKPVAMVCTTTCGIDDDMTLLMREDVSDVTGMTCDITLSGSAAQCSVRLTSPETVAANSALAIRMVNDGSNNCSAGDVECIVYITY